MKLLLEAEQFSIRRMQFLQVALAVLLFIYGLAIFGIAKVADPAWVKSLLKADLLSSRVASLTEHSPRTLPYYAASLVVSPVCFVAVLTVFGMSLPFRYWTEPRDAPERRFATFASFIGALVLCVLFFLVSGIGGFDRPVLYYQAIVWPIFPVFAFGAVVIAATGTYQVIGFVVLFCRKGRVDSL